jgi:hypothetical protein
MPPAITGMKPQSKLWKQIPQKAAGYKYLLMRYNSTNKLQVATLLMFGSHYPPLCGIIPLTPQISLHSFSASVIKFESHKKISNAEHWGEYQEVLAGKRQLRLFDHWQLFRI